LAQSPAPIERVFCLKSLSAVDMAKNRSFKRVILATVVVGILGGCHVATHVPPGQVKKIVNPPPGHGGIPPGQMKK
jgi:hypothetical protein